MLFFGHIGITAFLGALLYLPILIVGIGSILPDLVDKSLLILGVTPYTRLFAHNVFFGPIVSLITLLVTRRKHFATAMLFGSYMHLIEDISHTVPWFWPFVNYDLAEVVELKVSVDIFEIVTELIGLSLLAVLFAFRKQVFKLREKYQ